MARNGPSEGPGALDRPGVACCAAISMASANESSEGDLLASHPQGRYHRRLMNDLTQLLSVLGQGDPHAESRLLSLVYDELAGWPPSGWLASSPTSHEATDALSRFAAVVGHRPSR